MKKYIFTFCTLFFITTLSAQIQRIEWALNDTLVSQQKIYKKDGTLQLENKIIDKQLHRIEYGDNNQIIIQCEILQRRGIDTFVSFDPETYKETIEVSKNISDRPNGKYIEYYEGGTIKTNGIYHHYYRIGEWKYYYPNGDIWKVITYNKYGQKRGMYEEYYEEEQLKIKGKWEVQKYTTKRRGYDPITYKEKVETYEKEEEVKIGEWIYYLETGEVEKKEFYVLASKEESENKLEEFYNDGTPKESIEIKNEIYHGISKKWYPNGQLSFQGNWVHGKKEGWHIFYFNNGNISKKMWYQLNEIKKEIVFDIQARKKYFILYHVNNGYTRKYWYENGKKLSYEKHKNGAPITCITYIPLNNNKNEKEEPSCHCGKKPVFWNGEFYVDNEGNRVNENYEMEYKQWYENGQLKIKTIYKNKKEIKKQWDENGNEIPFDDGD